MLRPGKLQKGWQILPETAILFGYSSSLTEKNETIMPDPFSFLSSLKNIITFSLKLSAVERTRHSAIKESRMLVSSY